MTLRKPSLRSVGPRLVPVPRRSCECEMPILDVNPLGYIMSINGGAGAN